MRYLALLTTFALACSAPPEEPEACAPDFCTEPDRVCVDGADGPGCECREGLLPSADGCHAPERCGEGTCGGRGTCSEDGGVVQCECGPEYAGPLCERCADGLHDDGMGGCTDDACAPNPCGSDRRCVEVDGAPVCACPAGMHDEDGACVPDASCLPSTCTGHGSCADEGGAPVCTCEDGWAGAFCTRCDAERGYHDDGAGGCTTDPCLPNPCTMPNQSVCTAEDDGSASCACDPGFHPGLEGCVADEVCEADTCGGHGTCAVIGGVTECTCESGWAGEACAMCDAAAGYHDDGAGGCSTDPCLPNPCTMPNQSVCTADVGGAVCGCDPGYHDDGVGGCTADPCVPDPCAASGMACRDDGAGNAECYTPTCDDGNPCTDDAFSGGACVFTPRADGAACSTTLCVRDQVCAGGVCGGGSPVSCDDGNACTADACDALTGCANTVDDAIVPDDGLACTTDACSGGVASHTPDDAACDDADWCTGVERCAPASAGADARGCVAEAVPQPPGPNTTCATYVCDGAAMRFDVVAAAAGLGCDDRIACTSGDVCDGAGACVGALTAACGATGTCASTTPWSGAVDVAPARVVGSLLYGGSTTFPATESSTDVTIYLRAQYSGVMHRLEEVSFERTATGGVYPVTSYDDGDDRLIDLPVMPGIYDVVYRRWSYASSGGELIYSHFPNDAYAHANRVLMTDVVIGPGLNHLDVDVAPARVTGSIRYAGSSSFPATESSTDVTLYLRAEDTGVMHRLEDVSFERTATGGVYPVTSYDDGDDRVIDLPVLPGVYDVVYRRWSYASSDGELIHSHFPNDPYAHANRILMEDVVIGPGSTTLTIDVAPVQVSGSIVFNGGASFPATESSTDVGLYLRAEDTGVMHRLEDVSFERTATGGVYPVTSYDDGDDRVIDLPVLPGVYDVVYRRWSYASSGGELIYSHFPSDPYAHANRVLMEDVVIGPGSTTLTIDVAPVQVSGSIVFNGGASFPATESSTDVGLYLRAQDTGVMHRLEEVSFERTATGGVYPVTSYDDYDDRVIDLPVLPGVYDVVYRRWSYASSDGELIYSHFPNDPYAHANRVLMEDVVIGPGSTLTIDVAPAQVTGSIVYGGGASFPATESSTDVGLYLRARDTGVMHRLEEVSFERTATGGVYPVTSYDDDDDRVIDLPVLPGVYDVVYRRWSYASSGGELIYSHFPQDAYAHANIVINACVQIP